MHPNKIQEVVSRVLRVEAEALADMAERPPESLASAVELILATRGRMILSGMGKSGHIARKIASTFASTGTPAFFVHPAEASHGDLGMITPQDLVLVISNSGETPELGDLLDYCLRFSVPVIGISKIADSTLMRAASLRLLLPPHEEACALGMAPTTSTTLTLGLGDALAIAVMEARAFRPDQFRSFHPGGKLGARLATVRQLMHDAAAIPLVGLDSPMPHALLTMTESGFGITGVTDAAGSLVGVISDGDLRRNMEGLMTRTAGQVATRSPVTIQPDAYAAEAVALMNDHKIGAVFVVTDNGKPEGLIRLHDCLRAGVA
ncbi:MAG: SIS domain-containing protein [Paracoccaceae bacterium]